MSELIQEAGGRIPLFDPKTLTTEQKKLYDTIAKKMVPWAESAGFQACLPDGRLIGPFNSILASPDMASSFLTLQASEQEHTSLTERVRQVVILTVGAVWKSAYELYAHSAVARKAGFSDDTVQALSQGQESQELSDEERIAQRFTKLLTAGHEVEDQAYKEAVVRFGTKGIVDLIILAGCYNTVCSLLNTFQVPVPR